MEKRNWIELSHTLIQKYKIYSLYSTIKSLPLEIFITAVSNFSGPIALLLDKNINHQFILPEAFTNNIAILNCKGQLMKTIPFNYKEKIIFMSFTKNEQLLIVDAFGQYWLIDAFSGQIVQGNYSQGNEKQEKFRGCELLLSNKLILIKQKQLGLVPNLTSIWEPISDIKIKFQNPIFSQVFQQESQITYLSKQNSIELYNIQTKKRVTLYTDSFLSDNSLNLLAISFNRQKKLLGLSFKNPSVLLYIQLLTNSCKKCDQMIQLNYDLTSSNTRGLTSKYVSKNAYKPMNYTLTWLNQNYSIEQDLEKLDTSILVFGNPKLLIFFDGRSTRMTPRSNCNQLISVEVDSLRVYSEDSHEIYRIVPYLYQTILEINSLNEGYYNPKYMKIIQLHDEFTNYIEKDIIDLSKFEKIWKQSRVEKNKQELQIGLSQQVQRSNLFLNKQNTEEGKQQIARIEETILRPLLKVSRYCIDPVDQVKMIKFILFIKNLYTSPFDLYEVCQQMRIINNLKFQFLSRNLTLKQFQFLKVQLKDKFLTILLRYKMHFIADTIFKDFESKYKIFLHWAKCKIEKNNQGISFEQIKQKYDNMPKKYRNSKVFTDIAKYALDRGKVALSQRIIQLDQNPDRRIMMYLLILASISEKKIIEKLLSAAQQSSRSFLIYRVIRQLLQSSPVENHAWVNILYHKPNVARHYVNYLKCHGKQELLKNYYIQNKDIQNLATYGLERIFSADHGQEISIPKFSQQALQQFIPKIEEIKKILPNVYSVTKSFSKNAQLQLLRKVKNTDYIPSQEQLKQVRNDNALDYLGQILFKKEKIDSAGYAIKKIRSDKVYNALMRKQMYREAIEVAFQRKNKQAIEQIRQKCPPQYELLIEEKLKALTKK